MRLRWMARYAFTALWLDSFRTTKIKANPPSLLCPVSENIILSFRSDATGRSRSGVLPCGGNVGNRITLGGLCLKKRDETPQSPLLSFVSEYIQGVVRETDHMVFHDFLTEILAKTPMLVDRISVTSVCIFPSINPGFKKTQAGKAAALLEGSARTQSSTISRCCSAES